MRENSEQNEAFVALHEKMSEQGYNRDQIIKQCITQFNLGGKNPRHTYRAFLARLADPNKYGGRFSERMKKFQQQRNKKIAAKTETEKPVEVNG